MEDYPDISLVTMGPTRGSRTLDLIYTNFPGQITESGTVDPLPSDDSSGAPSDHRVAHCTAELKRYASYEWIPYSYMRQTEEGNLKFKSWILDQDWETIYSAVGSDNKAQAYQDLMNLAMKECYPIITVKRKSTEDPWITDKIRKKLKKRKVVFKKHGRSQAWKKLKKVTDKMIKYCCEKYYMESHKLITTSSGSSSQIFKHVRSYNTAEKPLIWNLKLIKPDLSAAQLAMELSLYFNWISSEFAPLC